MKADGRWAYALLLVVLECAVSGPGASACDADAQDRAPADVKTIQSAGAAAGQSGMRAYFDPQTGKIGPPPADQAAPPASPERANNTSAEGLVIVPAPGGGQMVDLQGRFQTDVTATLEPDGTVETDGAPSSTTPAAAVGR